MAVAIVDELRRSGPDVRQVDHSNEEAALIRKIVGGQQDLFGDLIAPYLSPLSRIVRTTIGGHSEVEDIVQQTALKAFTHLAQFRFEAGFRTWLTQIAINEARQWRRKQAHLRFLEFGAPRLSELLIADQRQSPLVEYQRSETGVQVGAGSLVPAGEISNCHLPTGTRRAQHF